MSDSGFWPGLRGRQGECDTLSRLVASAQAGRSQVLVLRGEAGIGKTALLEFLADSARGCQVGRAAGVESELEFAYAGLHQLRIPHLDRIGTLPAPQRAALGTAFGLQPGRAPDRFLLGLAVLTLLSEVAEEQPLICIVDDAQWLDQASAQTLEFVARRLAAEPVGLVFAVRETDEEPKLAGLPDLRLRGLGIDDAATLLESAVPGTLDPRVRNRILAWLAAMRGHEKHAEQLIQDTLNAATALGQGVGLNMMYAARATLCNGLGRYEDALAAAREAATEPLELGPTKWALANLVEAGVRSGNTDAAASAFEQLSAMTRASGTDLALGIEAARRALLHDDDTAEELYREAIERLSNTRIRVELARAQLLYGEWLRRHGRRADARAQLRIAYEALTAMGVEAFADRARHELAASGETVRKRAVETRGDLTAQEAHIARLAAEGLTSPEIAAALYLSPRTVEWHLSKIFAKLGVSTRRQLRRLPTTDRKGTSG